MNTLTYINPRVDSMDLHVLNKIVYALKDTAVILISKVYTVRCVMNFSKY